MRPTSSYRVCVGAGGARPLLAAVVAPTRGLDAPERSGHASARAVGWPAGRLICALVGVLLGGWRSFGGIGEVDDVVLLKNNEGRTPLHALCRGSQGASMC